MSAMFSKVSTPIRVGSLLRYKNSGNRIHIVVSRKGNIATLIPYGLTNKGHFLQSTSPRKTYCKIKGSGGFKILPQRLINMGYRGALTHIHVVQN